MVFAYSLFEESFNQGIVRIIQLELLFHLAQIYNHELSFSFDMISILIIHGINSQALFFIHAGILAFEFILYNNQSSESNLVF
jgi:hypothetical protein